MRAIVTGGGSGIGAAAAELLRERGARVIVMDRSVDEGDDAIRVDVTDAAAIDAAVSEAARRLGGLDVVINNAGVGAQGTVEDNDDDEWHQVFDVNVVGMVRVARAALPVPARIVDRPRSSTRARSPRRPGSRTGRSTARRKAPCVR